MCVRLWLCHNVHPAMTLRGSAEAAKRSLQRKLEDMSIDVDIQRRQAHNVTVAPAEWTANLALTKVLNHWRCQLLVLALPVPD